MIIKINKHIISKNDYPFIIAELSGNHKKSLKRALKLVDLAADSGASAIKLQTFKPDKVTLNIKRKDFVINDRSSPWYKRNIHDLFNEAYTPWEWHKEIFQKAESRGLEFLSTPFHEEAVDFLEKLNVPCYKVASFENNHIPLIETISQTKKPVIVSTGMASIKELFNIKNVFDKNKNKFVFLKCTSAYPATAKSFNLNTLKDIEKRFKCITGLSDHSLGSAVASSSIALGARVIEKHLTISRNDKAIDSFFSSDKDDFKRFIQNVRLSFESLGNKFYGPTKEESSSIQERRSIYSKKRIRKGENFTRDNIAVIRPFYGLNPIYFNKILGKKSKKDLSLGSRITKKSF